MDTEEKQQAILSTIISVPEGMVSSYGQIAKNAGLPGYARYVGYLLRNLSANTQVPWHRVVNAKGLIAFPVTSEKFLEQKRRLTDEGINVSTAGKIPSKHML